MSSMSDSVVRNLVNAHNQCVAVIYEDRVEFREGLPLKESLQTSGILIPEAKQRDFQGRKIVLLNDPLFTKAFVEIYFPSCLRESGYKMN